MNKVKDEELNRLQEFENFFKKANEILGKLTSDFEFKKSDVLRQINEKYIENQEFKKELSKAYGIDISINLETGDITNQTAK